MLFNQRLLKILLIMLAAMCTHSLAAQFIGGGSIGINAAQINGDELAGFNKVGLHAGIIGGYQINERTTLHLEILYSERGSRSILSEQSTTGFKNNYLEVPVYISYKDWEKDGYYKLAAGAGLSYGNLIATEDFLLGETPLTNDFRRNDLSWLVQVQFFARPKWSFDVRYTRSINKLFNNEKSEVNNNSLLGYHLTLRTSYFF